MSINLAQKNQIALFIIEKIIISAEYTDFANVFSQKLTKVLEEQIGINRYTIKLINNR